MSTTTAVQRTIKTAEYVRAADRTDGKDYIIGDVTHITFNECDHVGIGAPHVHFYPGERFKCHECGKEQS